MVLWIVFGVMAAAAVAAILRPLLARRDPSPARSVHEAAVFRDQLDELERDVARGVISATEAAEARSEVGRRLIAASDAAKDGTPGPGTDWRRPAAVIVATLVPAVALGSYLALGSPQLPRQPFAAREAVPIENQDLASLVSRVERHLQQEPADASGWAVIAPAYMRLRRFDDAVSAFSRAIALGGETPERLASLGEARVFAAGGMVDADARAAFERSLALDRTRTRPRYYLGLAAVQDGDVPRAVEIWDALVASAPEDAPWLAEVNRQLAAARQYAQTTGQPGEGAGPAPPGPTADDVAAAGALSSEERGAMIEGMVAGLAQRLEDEGGAVDEWLRLMRAYVVLGRTDDARDALAHAREAFAGDGAGLRALNDAASALGLGS